MTGITVSQEPPKPILEEPISEEFFISNPLLKLIAKHIDVANQSYIDLENIKFKVMTDMSRDKKFVDDVWKDEDVYHSSEFCVILRSLFRQSTDIYNYQEMQIRKLVEVIKNIVNEVKSVPRAPIKK